MDTQSILNCALIGTGACIIVTAMLRIRILHTQTRLFDGDVRNQMTLYFSIHQGLMAFFLLGYLASIFAIIMQYPLLSETFVSFIFLFGAAFVFLVVDGQRRIVAELQKLRDTQPD